MDSDTGSNAKSQLCQVVASFADIGDIAKMPVLPVLMQQKAGRVILRL